MHVSPEIVFYDDKYQNLRPIFAAARKSIFGKVVTLSVLLHKYGHWYQYVSVCTTHVRELVATEFCLHRYRSVSIFVANG